MSLKNRFAIVTLVFLVLAGLFLLVIEDQLDEVKRVRTHIKDDWAESRLLSEIQSTLARMYTDKSPVNSRHSSLSDNVAHLRVLLKDLSVHAQKDVSEKPAEKKELEALAALVQNVEEWQDLIGRMKSLTPGELNRETERLYGSGNSAIVDFAHGTWEELDESLEDLSASEDRIEELIRTWTAGMLGLLALAWAGFFLWLMRPIARLRRMVRSINKNDFHVEPVQREPAEIEELVQTFSEMAREIQAFTENLEKRVAERTQELESSREQLRQMLNRLPDAVSLVDPTGRVLLTNDGYRNLMGDGTVSPLPDILRQTPNEQGYYRWQASGTMHLLQAERFRLSPDPDHPENFVMLEYVRDVTRQCEIEAALASSQTLAAVGRLSSGIAHEINNPLTAIAACSEGLLKRLRRDELEPEVCEEYLSTIHDEVFRCKDITEKLLDFSRQRPEPPVLFDAANAAQDVVKLVEAFAAKRSVSISCNANENQKAWTSARAIKQVLLNLLMNAIEACTPGGCVQVVVDTTEEHLVIQVIDDGVGIPDENLERIFEPFFTQRKDNSGTGLGLFICKGIVDALGGTIDARNRVPDPGSIFRVMIPRRKRVADEKANMMEALNNGV